MSAIQDDGLVVVDKPAGITSHDVVSRVRKIAQTRRVGHAGTLDPMATGVLVLGVNRATRLLHFLVGADKTYRATIRLGVHTTTEDATGEVISTASAHELTSDDITREVAKFRGQIQQVPSAVSAIKVGGKRAYERVRAGEEVALAPRAVTVESFAWENLRFEHLPTRSDTPTTVADIDAEVTCSSGTYIRALARDLGNGLGLSGHLRALRRTRVGPYSLEQSQTLEELEKRFVPLPVAAAARQLFPARHLSASESTDLSYGKWISMRAQDPAATKEAPVAAFSDAGQLIALLSSQAQQYRPIVVFAPATS